MPPSLPRIGQTLVGRYLLEAELGEGALSVVFRSRDRTGRVERALKVLKPEALAQDPDHVRRFEREVRILRRLDSPHVVALHDWGTTKDGLPFHVMELLSGRTLGQEVEQRGPLPPARVRLLALQVLDALQVLHSCDVVHRDLKPDNLMYCNRPGRPDFVKVIDLGLARGAGNRPQTASIGQFTADPLRLGTPLYGAGEQWLGRELGPASDLYSLGLVLAFALCGQPINAADNLVEVLRSHFENRGEHPLPRAVLDTGELGRIIARAIRKNPGERYGSATEMRAALVRLEELESEERPGRPGSVELLSTVSLPFPTPHGGPRDDQASPECAPCGRPELRPGVGEGEVLEGRYQVGTLLAETPEALIFRGTHLRLDRAVALKVLRPGASEQARRQLERELALGRLISHPVALLPHEQGESEGGQPFLVSELPEGDTLAHRLFERRALDDEQVRALGIQLASLLDAAHQRGLLHGALLPEQVVFCHSRSKMPLVRLQGWRGPDLPGAGAPELVRELKELGLLLAAARSGRPLTGDGPGVAIPQEELRGSLGHAIRRALSGELSSAAELLAELEQDDGGDTAILRLESPAPRSEVGRRPAAQSKLREDSPTTPPRTSSPARPAAPAASSEELRLAAGKALLRRVLQRRLGLLGAAEKAVIEGLEEEDLLAALDLVMDRSDPAELRRMLFGGR